MREHLETFLARRAEEGEPMPCFVVDELRDYLECGVLALGAVRFACSHCGEAARVIEGFSRDRARALGIIEPRTGSITAVQRFGSDLALNLHFHMLFVDGVYDVLGAFTPIAAPTRDELEALCTTIAERVGKLFERRALDHDEPQERALCLALSSSAARRGADKHAPEGTDPDHDGEPSWKLKARVDGFDLEVTTVVRGDDRERLENLCRYLLRPPLADRRLRLLPAEQVALELKSPWRDGTRWISMSADTFLQRLSSLVPRPRTHQVLYRGVLAAHSARRQRVVPERNDETRHRPRNATFCELMKHGLAMDVLACPCGHRMKYVATIFDRKGLARLLRAKGLPHQLEPIRPARGPPQGDFDFGS
ncbi:MAG: transposase [Deltaproteobacteria bacterium]